MDKIAINSIIRFLKIELEAKGIKLSGVALFLSNFTG